MLDLESKVRDLLETEYGIEEKIKEALDVEISRQVRRWMDRHSFESTISDYVILSMDDNTIEEAIETAIEGFIEDAF